MISLVDLGASHGGAGGRGMGAVVFAWNYFNMDDGCLVIFKTLFLMRCNQ